MNSPFIKTYPVDQSKLSLGEQKMLKKLIAAAQLVAPLYEAQKNQIHGANFYPSDASREEIEQAVKKNPAILSPYTFVGRNHAGKLAVIPYSQKFKKELKKIAILVKEAAAESHDQAFKDYLVARAEDLLKDNFDRSNALWLKASHSKIGCVIGPFDRDLDPLFFQKRSYKAYVGVLDERQTREMERFRTMILASQRKYFPGVKKARISQVTIRVEDTAVIAGSDADSLFVTDNLPSSADLYLIKKYGMISTVFKPVIERRFSDWLFPIFEELFSKDFQKRYPREELAKAFLLVSTFVEICHSLVRYYDAASRLQDFFPYFDEAYTEIFGIKVSELLFLKGALSERELEAITLVEICQGVYYLAFAKERPHLRSFATGYAAFFDFLFDEKAFEKDDKGFHLDFRRTFIIIDRFTHIFEYYLSLATRDEAKEFIGRFRPEEMLERFALQAHRVLGKFQKR